MTTPDLTHALSVRSDFSLGESILQIDALVERAKALGYTSVALCDTMTISGMTRFTEKAKKAGIKPIIGVTLRVFDDPTLRERGASNREYRLKAYVRNDEGMRGILKLLSIGYQGDHFYYHARVGLEEVLQLPVDGVVLTTGDLFSVWHHPAHREVCTRIQQAGFTLYAELVPVATPLFDTLNQTAFDTAVELKLPTIVARPVFYGSSEEADTLDVHRAITSNNKMSSRTLSVPYVRDFCFKPPIDVVRDVKATVDREPDLAAGFKIGLGNMAKLAELCTYEFKKLDPCLPKMAESEFAELARLVREGWAARFGAPVFGHRPDDLEPYKQRLAYELDTLKRMGFAGYFLLVAYIVRWSKENGIYVGPGRGSVGGSLVAYLMGITDVDPLRFGLIFERFINPERIDLPDADLDFQTSRRHEVIAHIIDKFGADHVAGISNYATLGAASALRDTSRVHELDPLAYACSKQMEKEHGVSLSLEESAERVPDIHKFKNEYPHIWKHAITLEGCMRNLGQHAAGVVVAGEPITNRAVVETRSESVTGGVINWDKTIVENWGLIKMDILGLSTLDIIAQTLKYIKERHGKHINILRLPLGEKDVMAAFGRGETVGIFQFEGSGMRSLLKRLAEGGELTFEDITAATALFRPGPLDAGLCDQFVQIKQGAREPYYEHPLMEDALKETYGVIVYQEQVMQVCRDLAGFSMADADHIRKAMGKKDAEKMAEWGEKFIAGAVKAGMHEMAANALWDKIVGFAGYAFNKSHSVEYTLISYMTMWLKVRYPAEFYAAAMSVQDKDEKLQPLVADAERAGLEVLPPDLQISSGRIEIVGERKLYAPFNAVKGMSESAAWQIKQYRDHLGGAFPDLDTAIDSKKQREALGLPRAFLTPAKVENLRKVGALVCFEGGLPALHPDRLKDRIALMPGYTVGMVKASRTICGEEITKLKILRLAEDTHTCDKCSLRGNPHPMPRFGSKPKFMMVFDAPSYHEGRAGQLLHGDTKDLLQLALKDHGLTLNDGYYTTLVKSPKPSGEKTLANEQIIACSEYLKQEIELLKPPIIIAMGAAVSKFFSPDSKVKTSELVGKAIYRPDLDATIVFGLNPAQILFDASKLTTLQKVCEVVSETLN